MSFDDWKRWDEQLENDVLTAIADASDETGIEAVRVAALGKKGSVSEKMKTLGKMSPEERKEMGPLLNGLRSRITDAIAERTSALKTQALAERLAK
ncbi:MAG: hypothetical protein AAGF95_22005, partial [Chloroflexota bacterium]